jgi:hypothetical protein
LQGETRFRLGSGAHGKKLGLAGQAFLSTTLGPAALAGCAAVAAGAVAALDDAEDEVIEGEDAGGAV